MAASRADQLSEIICSTHDSDERKNCEAELGNILNDDPFSVLGHTSSNYTLVCSSVILVQLFKKRRHEGGPEFIERFLMQLLRTIEDLFRSGACQAFAVKAVLTALCKCQKLAIDGWDTQANPGAATKTPLFGLLNSPLGTALTDPASRNNNNGESNQEPPPPPCNVVRLVLDRISNNNPNLNDNGYSNWFYMRILSDLIEEMSKFDGGKSATYMNFSAHRRASTTFRDNSLRAILPFCLNGLKDLLELMKNNKNNRNNQDRMCGIPNDHVWAVCDLASSCFNYDFMAIIVDETEESFVSQFPTEWRDILLDTRDALDVIREAHLQLPPPFCNVVLRAVIGLIGARRSFFLEPQQKVQWLDFFMQTLMSSTSGNGDRINSEKFCSTLAESVQRFLPPHTYSDLCECPSWGAFIEWVAGFSRTVFSTPFGRGQSFQTTTVLMTFWNRLINSKRLYMVSTQPPNDIEEVVPDLIRIFVETRLTQVDEDLDEDAVDAVTAQTDLLPTFFSVRTSVCVQGVAGMLMNAGAQRICNHPSTILWACHAGAGLLRSLVPNVTEETCQPLAAFIKVLCESCTTYLNRRTPGSFAPIEHAVIAYLTSLQLVFTSMRLAPNVMNLMNEVFGRKYNLFQFLLDSVGSNIMSGTLDAETVDGSLDLIIDACGDLATPDLMQLKLDLPPTIELPMARNPEMYKLRAKLLHMLYIVRLPDPFGVEDFHRFLRPIGELMRSDEKDPLFVGGWLRDLKGVAAATANSEGAFAEFLQWIMQNADIFYSIAGVNDLPTVITDSLLKFLRQLVTAPRQSGGRLNIPSMVHSPAGLLLMQFCMRIVTDVMRNLRCPRNLPADGNVSASDADHVYETFLKHVQTAMNITRLCVSSDFCPFGAMALYEDNRFGDAVLGIVNMISQIPIRLIKDFAPVAGTFSQLLQTLVQNQLTYAFLQMGPDQMQFVIKFALSVVGDTETKTVDLAVSLDFLGWVASTRPVIDKDDPTDGSGRVRPAASSRYMMRQARYIFGKKLVSLGYEIYDHIATAAMDIVTTQDRCMPQAASCAYPIFDSDSAAFGRYANYLVNQYSRAFHKEKVQGFLDNLCSDVPTQDRFFSKLVEFRSSLRNLGL